MEAYSNDQNIVERCCQTCIQVINCDLSNNAVLLVDQLLTEVFNSISKACNPILQLLSIYTRQPQSYVLQSAGSVIEEYTVGINAEETIGHFLNVSPLLLTTMLMLISLVYLHPDRCKYRSGYSQPAAHPEPFFRGQLVHSSSHDFFRQSTRRTAYVRTLDLRSRG